MFGGSSGRLPSSVPHNFASVPSVQIPRSVFDRSHTYKTTFDAGYLIPVYVDEALPGDTFNMKMTTFARMATPKTPIMDNMYCDVFFFAVPIRLIWENWERFNGAQDDPDPDFSASYLVPTMTSTPVTGYDVMTLHDYFGLPTGVPGLEHASLWHRAYNLIWNEWFRDQNLQDSVVVDVDDGPDSPTDYVLLKRGKRHDYFTSALPWPQKGPSVLLPLGSEAPVLGIAKATQTYPEVNGQGYETFGTAVATYAVSTTIDDSVSNERFRVEEDPNNTGYPYIRADLSEATAATINELRQAFQIQKMYERDARGGTRYTEVIRSHFGVISPDARLQRPEYLGGGSTYVNMSPVPQTSVTGTTPQGNLAAFGTFSHSGIGFNKSFTEHCVLLGLVSVRADLTYQQGLNRMFSRQTRFDFYWPALSHLGEQAVLNKEIYAQGTANPTDDEAVFGYQERYAEYRYKPNQITGKFRSTYSTPLDQWHLAQEFSSLPVLGDTFIQEDPPVDRVIAVPAEPHFLFDCHMKLKCARPMPTFSVPGLIDHF